MLKFLILPLLTIGILFAQTHSTPPFNAALFKKAKQEKKIIVMDLEAVWCHWCHVMDKKTYAHPKVKALLEKYFLFVRVDHDARPDLAQKYREYGWPATIFFDPSGKELIKRAGYIAPQEMIDILQSLIKNPKSRLSEGKTSTQFTQNSKLPSSIRQTLIERDNQWYDTRLGGLAIAQKYLEDDSIAYAMLEASLGNTTQYKRARQTLDAAIKLIDPVWGGAYQYSTHGDWDHAHYEKIMRIQSRYIKRYALAAKQFDSPKYLKASKDVAKYVLRFLRDPSGAFYVSQDADLKQGQKAHSYFTYSNAKRLSLGIPRIDKNLYASSQGEMIEALSHLYEASHETKYLTAAKKSAFWALRNRFVYGGGFAHGKDTKILYLYDNIAMGEGFLALYRATGEVRWLRQASKLGYFLERHFKANGAGIFTATDNGTPVKPVRNIDENIQAARFMNLLSHYTGKSKHQKFAKHIMRYLATQEIALSRITEAGILLCDYELSHDPLHITVNGNPKDKRTAQLKKVALDRAPWYARVDLVNLARSKPYNPDIQYPKLNKPAAFICSEKQCSMAYFSPRELTGGLERFLNQKR